MKKPDTPLFNGYGEKQDCKTVYSETFYEGVRPEDIRRAIRHEQQILAEQGPLVDQTEYKSSYSTLSPEPHAAHKQPPSSLRLEGEQEMQSGYNMDFVPKLRPCPAGELIESVKKNHATTEHFEFHRVHSGHHFYEPKPDVRLDD
ncbi:unnamed protein product [Toxocara canis]|nr:unnamed protein product [Toxocara canis]